MSIKDQAQAGPSRSASKLMRQDASDYVIGDRYLNAKNNQPVTIRYIGPLPYTLANSSSSSKKDEDERVGESQQHWIGIEYDDPSFGKHTGTYQNIQMFNCRCRTPGATPGAFIKSTSAATTLKRGKTLIEAIEERYGAIVPLHDNNSNRNHEGNTNTNTSSRADERGVLGSSNGAINVEMPNMDRVRKRMGQLERLKNMGFDTDHIYALDSVSGDGVAEKGEVRDILRIRLKGVRWLNLSRNLISSWKVLAEIINHFQGLDTLSLNHSRFEPLETLSSAELEGIRPAFDNVVELHLSACLLSWEEICHISYLFRNIHTLHLEDNPLNLLQAKTVSSGQFDRLRELNLARCGISNWTEILSALVDLPLLENLDLSWTDLRCIPPPSSVVGTSQQRFTHLRQLNLHHTFLKEWNDIDNLDEWTSGTLTSLKLSRRDIILNDDDEYDDISRKRLDVERGITGMKVDRAIVIGKMSNLQIFNSTNISEGERRDAELYYLSSMEKDFRESLSSAKGDQLTEGMWVWKRYIALCGKFSREPISLNMSDKEGNGGDLKQNVKMAGSGTGLQSKLIAINLCAAPGTRLTIPPSCNSILILPTSSKTLLVRKAAKILGVDPKILRLWNVKETETGMVPVVHITDPWDKKDVGWWLENEDYVMCCREDELEAVRIFRDCGDGQS